MLAVSTFGLAIFAYLLNSSLASTFTSTLLPTGETLPTPNSEQVPLEASASHMVKYWRSLRHAQKVSLLALTLHLPRAHSVFSFTTGTTTLEEFLKDYQRAKLSECSSEYSSGQQNSSESGLQAEKLWSLEQSVRSWKWPDGVEDVRTALGSTLELLSTFIAPYVGPIPSTTPSPTASTTNAPECNARTAEPLSAGALGSGGKLSASPVWLAMAPVALCVMAVAALGGWGMSLKLWCLSRSERSALRKVRVLTAVRSDSVELLSRLEFRIDEQNESERSGTDGCNSTSALNAKAHSQFARPLENEPQVSDVSSFV